LTRQDAVRRAARGFVDAGRWVVRFPLRLKLALRDLEDARAVRIERQRSKAPSLRERQDELIRFYDRYEDLVETLCNAAQYGPDSRQETNYGELREWMQANYPPVRRFVSAYLVYDPKDAARAQDLHVMGRDAFEALFAPPTVEEFLKSDDGQMIARIERTREALNRYGEHLRQLIAKDRARP
jgi:hypothetical protein